MASQLQTQEILNRVFSNQTHSLRVGLNSTQDYFNAVYSENTDSLKVSIDGAGGVLFWGAPVDTVGELPTGLDGEVRLVRNDGTGNVGLYYYINGAWNQYVSGGGGGLSSDIIYYIDTAGSDTTGDGTVAFPFLTLQHALNLIPKNLNGHYVSINVNNGTYNLTSSIVVDNFFGGVVSIVGTNSDPTLVKFKNPNGNAIEISVCEAFVMMMGISFVGKDVAINTNVNTFLAIVDCCVSAISTGIYMMSDSVVMGIGNCIGETEPSVGLYVSNGTVDAAGVVVGVLKSIEVAGGTVIDENHFILTPAFAPTLDYEVANKKYVDDAVAGGTSGTGGSNGTSGTSGTSGITVNGTSGTDGTSGTSAIDGSNGTSGIDGTSGTSGSNGSNGIDGTNGSNGTSGTDGTSGSNGSNGTSGTDGSSGTSGTSGLQGEPGAPFEVDDSGILDEAKIIIIENSGATHYEPYIYLITTDSRSDKNAPITLTGDKSLHLIMYDGVAFHDYGQFNAVSGTSGTSGTDGSNGTSGSNGSNGTSGTSGITPVTTRIPVNDTNYNITGTNNQNIYFTAISAKRNVYLPPATTAKQTITIGDESGSVTPINRVRVLADGTDHIDIEVYNIQITEWNSVEYVSNGAGVWIVNHRNHRLSAGVVIAPSYTAAVDGTSITIGNDGLYNLFKMGDGSGQIRTYEIDGDVCAITDEVTNYIVADYTAGVPIIHTITNVTVINETTIIPLYTVYRHGTELHCMKWDKLGLALTNRIHQSIVKTQRYRLQSGLGISESSGRVVVIDTGIVWVGANIYNIDPFSSDTGKMILCSHVGTTWSEAVITQYDNTQYNDATGLHLLNPNKYAVNFVYRGIDDTSEVYIVLADGNYDITAAKAALPPILLPPIITSHALLIGRIIVEQAQPTAYQIDSSFSPIFSPSGIDGTSGTSGTDGSNGTSGTDGTSGIDGTSGTSGSNGSNGTSGIDGTSGTSGSNGSDGTSGTSGSNGSDGTSGTSGTDGSNGTSGTSGINGATPNFIANSFTVSDLSSGILTIAHTSGDVTLPYSISDNNGNNIVLDSTAIVFSNNQITINLLSYGSISGTWKYVFGGVPSIMGSNGTSGVSGTSGISGTSGTSGTDGSNGTSGTDGSNGTSGTSGLDGLTPNFISGTFENSTLVNGILFIVHTSGNVVLPYMLVDENGENVILDSSLIIFSDNLITIDLNLYLPIVSTWKYAFGGVPSGSGTSGTSGISGTSGVSGTSGTSGSNGSNGTSGTSGIDGVSVVLKGSVLTTDDLPTLTATTGDLYVVLADGDGYVFNGVSWDNVGAIQGPAGTSGTSGLNGTSGIDGTSGTTGTSGTSGSNGSNGTSGTSGTSFSSSSYIIALIGVPTPNESGTKGNVGFYEGYKYTWIDTSVVIREVVETTW